MSAFNPERQREEDLILQMRRKNDMTFATPDAKRVLAEKRALKPLEFTPLMRSPVKKTKADGKESSPSVQEYIPVKSSPPSTPMLDLEAPPPLPSSSIKMSPIPCLRPRAGQKGTNIHSFTFKEQEKVSVWSKFELTLY